MISGMSSWVLFVIAAVLVTLPALLDCTGCGLGFGESAAAAMSPAVDVDAMPLCERHVQRLGQISSSALDVFHGQLGWSTVSGAPSMWQ
jgi:hypothetical protein